MSGEPFPKSRQLERGERREYRFRANRAQWKILRETKVGPCRVCHDPAANGHVHGRIKLHRLIPRDFGGDDFAANLVPLCPNCYELVEHRDPPTVLLMLASLTGREVFYACEKLGLAWAWRVYRAASPTEGVGPTWG